jgi:L-glutamine-phosphate cytidylyltransferase
MAKLRAVVLAAGRGTRMGGATPKTLLPVDGKEPLLHYILEGLAVAGVDDLLVVTGHRPEEIQEYVTERSHIPAVSFVRNARYASWGNFHSVRVAIDQSPGMAVLVVNSDVVVHPDVYKRTADAPGELVLAVQRSRHLDEEDMRVELSRDRVVAIGKHLRMPLSHGEYAGVSLLRPDAARVYNEISTDLEWSAQTTLYYEDVYALMIEHKVDTRAAAVQPGEYAEVDTPEDVAAAAGVIDRHGDAWLAPTGAAPDA